MKATLFLALVSLALGGCAADVGSSEDALRQTCGGIAAIVCPEGYSCVDNPRDNCDPALGGADCGGICRRTRRERNRCDYNDPTKNYVGTSVEQCSLIRFTCEPGTSYFADDCGCGCQDSCNATGLCIEGYAWDETTCSCEPVPGPACGPVNCASGEVCCNESCGICTAPGGSCIKLYCN
jgi:hypothetical protein